MARSMARYQARDVEAEEVAVRGSGWGVVIIVKRVGRTKEKRRRGRGDVARCTASKEGKNRNRRRVRREEENKE